MTGKSYISKCLDMGGHTALYLGGSKCMEFRSQYCGRSTKEAQKVNEQNEHREMRNMQ